MKHLVLAIFAYPVFFFGVFPILGLIQDNFGEASLAWVLVTGAAGFLMFVVYFGYLLVRRFAFPME